VGGKNSYRLPAFTLRWSHAMPAHCFYKHLIMNIIGFFSCCAFSLLIYSYQVGDKNSYHLPAFTLRWSYDMPAHCFYKHLIMNINGRSCRTRFMPTPENNQSWTPPTRLPATHLVRDQWSGPLGLAYWIYYQFSVICLCKFLFLLCRHKEQCITLDEKVFWLSCGASL
jgi:hypothetical protein